MLCQGKLTAIMSVKLKEKGKVIAAQVAEAYAAIGKASKKSKIDEILDAIDLRWQDIAEEIRDTLAAMAEDGAQAGAAQLAGTVSVSLDLANEQAVAYANERAAELVGMKYVDGKLKPNPKAKWAITETTRKLLRGSIKQAMADGWSNDELANVIEDNYAFSQTRAEMIARTETAMADVAGNMIAYAEAEDMGVTVLKKWITANDDRVSPDCAMNGQSKPLPMKKAFPSGAQAPPDHPRCRCDVSPVVLEDEE
jgi:SPP1 gp7 family putative phage head morphogenesis protein